MSEPRDKRMLALAEANRVRLARASIKRQLRVGTLPLATALQDPACATATAGQMLGSLGGWGPARVNRLLLAIGASSTRRVCDLSDRQRGVLGEQGVLPSRGAA